jgi:hypothetical protein
VTKKHARPSIIVENSSVTRYRPRQPQLRKTPPRGTKPLASGKAPGSKVQANSITGLGKQKEAANAVRAKISAETITAAAATGMLPHEWLLAVMRGEQINHFAYDADTSEIVEIIVLPTFTDRMEAAKAAAPYYATRMSEKNGGPGAAGAPLDPNKAPGVLHIPLVESAQAWIDAATRSQSKLKREVVK